jgi:putative hydrolase of the HAD superfamily
MTEPVKAVLFDLDGTLHDRDRAFRAWAARLARERLKLADAEVADAVGFLLGLDAGGRGPKEAMFAAARERWPILREAPADLVEAFRIDLRAHIALDPAASGLLAALDAAAIPWGIVTNGTAAQHEKLAALGIAGRSPCVVVSEDVGLRKPDPAIFALAARQLGVEPADALFVGDHPAHDIVGAAAAGMRTAWLARGASWPEPLAATPPDLVLGSLDDLRGMIREGFIALARYGRDHGPDSLPPP